MTKDRMDTGADRLRHLLQTYGADPRRWPEAERAHVAASMASAEAMAEAAALDGWLDHYAVAAPDDALTQASIARAAGTGEPAAPAKAQRPRAWWWQRRGRPGVMRPGSGRPGTAGPGLLAAGLLSAGLAGLLAGVLLVSVVLRSGVGPGGGDWPERGTAFAEPSVDWSEE